MKIYALMSVDNNYDQPPNNLVCRWEDMPTVEMMMKVLDIELEQSEGMIAIGLILSRTKEDVVWRDTHYRIQELTEGIKL